MFIISCEDAKKAIKEKNAQLVDVRTPHEFSLDKLPGSVNIPLQDIDRVEGSVLDKNVPIILFCRSGQRSHVGVQILLSLGFNEVYNLGSYQTWFQCPDK